MFDLVNAWTVTLINLTYLIYPVKLNHGGSKRDDCDIGRPQSTPGYIFCNALWGSCFLF